MTDGSRTYCEACQTHYTTDACRWCEQYDAILDENPMDDPAGRSDAFADAVVEAVREANERVEAATGRQEVGRPFELLGGQPERPTEQEGSA